uniref:Putative secreted protein n=1 Tax=Ixodes ricinus TaxID=34613 RepID=A0A6B0V0F4_IXORI
MPWPTLQATRLNVVRVLLAASASISAAPETGVRQHACSTSVRRLWLMAIGTTMETTCVSLKFSMLLSESSSSSDDPLPSNLPIASAPMSPRELSVDLRTRSFKFLQSPCITLSAAVGDISFSSNSTVLRVRLRANMSARRAASCGWTINLSALSVSSVVILQRAYANACCAFIDSSQQESFR